MTKLLCLMALTLMVAVPACSRDDSAPTPQPSATVSPVTSTLTPRPAETPTVVARPTPTLTPSSSPNSTPPPVPPLTGSPETDRKALTVFYNATDGDNWPLHQLGLDMKWLSDAPLGEWLGVVVNEDGRVVELRLDLAEMNGIIPPELGDLAALEVLDLRGNRLRGNIPPEVGNLSRLKELLLYNNNLTGAIQPELGKLSRLEGLLLNANYLTGPIPPELGDLSELQFLGLWGNELTGGIPPELGKLSKLDRLHLYGNPLGGEIPPELGNMTALAELLLYETQLTGAIPPELGNLVNLEELHLQRNSLEGPIPPELGKLSKLRSLSIGDNRLSGPIPPELGSLSDLHYMYIGDNQLSGPVPPELGNLENLTQLVMRNNQLTGCIPSSLKGQLTYQEYESNVQYLDFCRPTGPSPDDSLIWSYPVGGPVVTGPVVSWTGIVYAGSDDGTLYALFGETGELLWSFTAGGPIRSISGDVDGTVYVGSNDNHLYALAADTGEELWRYDTGDWVQSSPAVGDGRVYFPAQGEYDRVVHAVDAASGKLVWAAEHPYPVDHHIAPTFHLGRVYAQGAEYGAFYVLDAATGSVLWQAGETDVAGYVESAPTVLEGVLHLNVINQAYAFDEATGEILWSVNTEEFPARDFPALAVNGIHYLAPGDYLYALDAATGEEMWRYEAHGLSTAPIVADGVLYGASEGAEYLFALRARPSVIGEMTRMGEVLWTLPTEDFRSYFLTVVDGVLYGQMDEGYLFAMDAGSGSILPWELETGGFSDVLHYAVSDGVVYSAGPDGRVYAHAAPTPGGD